jgi:alpha-N-acetylglucosaminidase
MLAADPKAIWLMQGWLFLDSGFWQPAQAEALLTSIPQGKMIVLDLSSENVPQFKRLQSYYGQPFVWCMLHNFGGTLSMFGAIEAVNEGPSEARAFTNSTMIGIGLTMEGINQNNVIYEFMLENSWRQGPRNLTQWMENYSRRRYGVPSLYTNYAWQIFKSGLYNCTRPFFAHGVEIVTVRPQYKNPISPFVWYSVEDFYQGWKFMLSAADTLSRSSLFRYDLVDVTRQAMQLIGMVFYTEVIKHYKAKDYSQFKYYSTELLDLFANLDRLLATDEHFLLGNWLESAKAFGTNEMEKRLYEYNARNQLTLWGPNGEILDYANKQWAGLVQAYYFPRWKLFLNQLDVQWNITFDEDLFNNEVFFLVEQPFTFDRTVFSTTPTGDQIAVAHEIHERYRLVFLRHSTFFRSLLNQSKKDQLHGETDVMTSWLRRPVSGDRMSSWNRHKYL